MHCSDCVVGCLFIKYFDKRIPGIGLYTGLMFSGTCISGCRWFDKTVHYITTIRISIIYLKCELSVDSLVKFQPFQIFGQLKMCCKSVRQICLISFIFRISRMSQTMKLEQDIKMLYYQSSLNFYHHHKYPYFCIVSLTYS